MIAAQYGLNTTANDIATVRSTLGRVSSPAILVGHPYGGSVITGAGTDDRVAGLVYIAALAPDADETSQTQQSNFPTTDVFSYIEVADGRSSAQPRRSPPPHIKSHEFSIMSCRRKNPAQKLSSTFTTNRPTSEPKCASANRQLDSASNSCPSRQRENNN